MTKTILKIIFNYLKEKKIILFPKFVTFILKITGSPLLTSSTTRFPTCKTQGTSR